MVGSSCSPPRLLAAAAVAAFQRIPDREVGRRPTAYGWKRLPSGVDNFFCHWERIPSAR